MSRVTELLEFLYGPERADALAARIRERMEHYAPTLRTAVRAPIDQKTALVITYGDQVTTRGQPPLYTLAEFLGEQVKDIVSGVHLLPFYPSSSDDGFAVMDYYAADPQLGSWEDIARVGRNFELMFDAVINHASGQGEWFRAFLRDESPYRDYFLVPPPDFDTTRVIRPRALPLLTPVHTTSGEKRVWTTFSADQIDLDYRNHELLLQVLDVLLFYVAHGARFIRLDAIAFLWKESGTTCLHLPQTHAVVQLMRAILDKVAPHVILVTETNVPHGDNISYFGDGDNEAHWVYNFALPPLTLHTFQTGNAAILSRWAQTLSTPSDRTAFFNFLASHDGIGLNPARGILSETEIENLVNRTIERGGLVSYKHNPDGTSSPYELNINYFDALTPPGERDELAMARFLCAHAIMLALRGVPGIYFHSLFGSRGDRAGADESGIPRRINREKLARAELEYELAATDSRRAQIFTALAALLRARRRNPAFHPGAPQVLFDDDPRVFALLRTAPSARAFCVHNVTSRQIRVQLTPPLDKKSWQDLITGTQFDSTADMSLELEPYQVMWLGNFD